MKLHYRTVFLSDVHLGCRAAQAETLGRFLKHLRCERLYLVGDIIDMWRLRAKWHWPESHNRVLRRLLDLSQRGTEVIFIPGNHDEAARQFVGAEFGGIEVKALDVHTLVGGQHLWVTHGDQFDIVVRSGRFLPMLGARGYNLLLAANLPFNAVRKKLGLPYASLSKRVKYSVKKACSHISHFEELLMLEAQRRGLDGVVCGHIHHPAFRPREDHPEQPVGYYNCGDWVEGTTALVEHFDGRLQLIDATEELAARKYADTFGAHGGEPTAEVDRDDAEDRMPGLLELIAYGRIFPPSEDPAEPSTQDEGAADPTSQEDVSLGGRGRAGFL